MPAISLTGLLLFRRSWNRRPKRDCALDPEEFSQGAVEIPQMRDTCGFDDGPLHGSATRSRPAHRRREHLLPCRWIAFKRLSDCLIRELDIVLRSLLQRADNRRTPVGSSLPCMVTIAEGGYLWCRASRCVISCRGCVLANDALVMHRCAYVIVCAARHVSVPRADSVRRIQGPTPRCISDPHGGHSDQRTLDVVPQFERLLLGVDPVARDGSEMGFVEESKTCREDFGRRTAARSAPPAIAPPRNK